MSIIFDKEYRLWQSSSIYGFWVIKDIKVTNYLTHETIILHRKDKVKYVKTIEEKTLDGLVLKEYTFEDKIFHLTEEEESKYLLNFSDDLNELYFSVKVGVKKIFKLGFITYNMDYDYLEFWFDKYFINNCDFDKEIVKYIFKEIFLYVQDMWIWADKIVLDFYCKNILNYLREMEIFLYKNKNKTFKFEIIKKYATLIQEIHSLIFEYGEKINKIETASEKYLDYKEQEKKHYLSALENLNARLDILTEYKNC